MFFRKSQIPQAAFEPREMKMHQRRIRKTIRRLQEEFPRAGDRTQRQGQINPPIHIVGINHAKLLRNGFQLVGISRRTVYFH